MYYTVTITINRPNTNSKFWYESDYYINNKPLISDMFSLSLILNEILDFNQDISIDQLTYKRVTIFKNKNSSIKFIDEFYKELPDYVQNRENYCVDNGHILTITEE